jgi:glycosyltransferase involved in cell wall biosynthesis
MILLPIKKGELSQMSNPLVSVGMSSYNNGETISQAISSLQRQIYSNWELIVIDANSNDETKLIIEKYKQEDLRIKSIYMPVQQSWLKSSIEQLQMASGQFFMWLDPDDIVDEKWISSLLEIHLMNNCIASIGTLYLINQQNQLVLNHPCTERVFAFTSSTSRRFRILGCLLLPEPFGLVNLLYGLWRIEALRDLELWTKDSANNSDQVFVLRALSKGIVRYTNNASHYRRTNWNFAKTGFISNDFPVEIKKIKRIKLRTFFFQLATCKPPHRLYAEWIRNEKWLNRLMFNLILNFRRVFSSCSVIVSRLNFASVKSKNN